MPTYLPLDVDAIVNTFQVITVCLYPTRVFMDRKHLYLAQETNTSCIIVTLYLPQNADLIRNYMLHYSNIVVDRGIS